MVFTRNHRIRTPKISLPKMLKSLSAILSAKEPLGYLQGFGNRNFDRIKKKRKKKSAAERAGDHRDRQRLHRNYVATRVARTQLSQQIIVTTPQCLLQPPNCCGQNIQLPGLNLLDGARG